jgi:hypothetical protein
MKNLCIIKLNLQRQSKKKNYCMNKNSIVPLHFNLLVIY